jgi:hypothetical protein
MCPLFGFDTSLFSDTIQIQLGVYESLSDTEKTLEHIHKLETGIVMRQNLLDTISSLEKDSTIHPELLWEEFELHILKVAWREFETRIVFRH